MSEISRDLERWLPVPEPRFRAYYEVSDLGCVRSVARTIEYPGRWGITRRAWPSKVLTLTPLWDGHLRCTLANTSAARVNVKVHILVLKAFVGPRPPGMEGCHNDGSPANNRLSNLRWDTPSSNALDRVRHGNNLWAEKTLCPRDHLLIEPNLMPSQMKRGYRSCLACSRASSSKYRFDEPEFKTIADAYYEEIMRAA